MMPRLVDFYELEERLMSARRQLEDVEQRLQTITPDLGWRDRYLNGPRHARYRQARDERKSLAAEIAELEPLVNRLGRRIDVIVHPQLLQESPRYAALVTTEQRCEQAVRECHAMVVRVHDLRAATAGSHRHEDLLRDAADGLRSLHEQVDSAELALRATSDRVPAHPPLPEVLPAGDGLEALAVQLNELAAALEGYRCEAAASREKYLRSARPRPD